MDEVFQYISLMAEVTFPQTSQISATLPYYQVMSVVCAICGVDFDIDAGKCPKCGANKRLATARGEIHIDDANRWLSSIISDLERREVPELEFLDLGEIMNEYGELLRRTQVIDRRYGIELQITETRDERGEWKIARLFEAFMVDG